MLKFRTKIPNSSFSFDFDHRQPILCMGSCFAEHIGSKLTSFKFTSLLNPFGILYNPYSIASGLEQLSSNRIFSEEDLFEANGQWHSFDHHGHFSDPEKTKAIQNINLKIEEGFHFLKKTNRLILTFGTSNVFVYKKTQEIVANCHKVPNHEFERKALSIESILEKLNPIFDQLKNQNPDLEILLTVSPIRHIRDGLIENQRSKSRLLLACEQLSKKANFIHYFPSYEIMMDDLRDYRFYKEDMIHPSDLAINYIWDYFDQCFFSAETRDLNLKISKIINAVQHRPFHPESEEHQSFLNKQLKAIERIQNEFNYLDFEKEVEIVNKQISSS